MNIRDAMKGPQDPERRREPGDPTIGKAVQEALATQERFEKVYLEVLDEVKGNWDSARKGNPIDLKRVAQDAGKMIDCWMDQKEAINLFKRVKDTPYYYLNVVNVAWISVSMGIELGYTQEKLVELGAAALLHDIGMSKIPDTLLTKKEKLTFEEYELVRQHPEEGKKIVSAIKGVSEELVMGIYQEHERENGSGYPEGRRGGQIHEYAKIIGLADVFEAMTHFRDFRVPVSPYEAIMELVEMKNRLFSDRLIKVFINQFTFYPVGSYVQLNSGEVGMVSKVNRNFPTRPTLEVIIDKEGNPVKKPFYMKLTDENLIYVKETPTEERVRMILEEKKIL